MRRAFFAGLDVVVLLELLFGRGVCSLLLDLEGLVLA